MRSYKLRGERATKLLNGKIDKLMTRFKQRSNTNFFNGYLAARVIVDK